MSIHLDKLIGNNNINLSSFRYNIIIFSETLNFISHIEDWSNSLSESTSKKIKY
jgi:hypothetical protein